MPLSQFFFRATFSCEIPSNWNQDCPRSDTCKAELQQEKMALCINRQETIQSHSFPVGPSEGRKTHHVITNALIITQFLLNLPPPLTFIPFILVERQLKETDCKENGYPRDPCQIYLYTNTFLDLVFKDIDPRFFASLRLWPPRFV